MAMKYVVCAVRDRVADVFGQPFFSASTGLAVRGFQDEVNRADDKNVLFRHPDDFDLFELGIFDDTTAKFVMLDQPRQLVLGKDSVRKSK